MKARKRMAKRKLRRSTHARRSAGTEPTGCKYVVKWSPLKSTRGFVQVWVPEKTYSRVARSLMNKTKDRYARMMLRQRIAPLGVTHTCSGTCSGGWCKEVEPYPGSYVCECSYFV